MTDSVVIPSKQQSALRPSASELWHLAQGEVLSLPLGRDDRLLSVVEGRLWLTAEGSEDEPPEDIWLEPGQTLQLHAARRLVAEASPSASFRVSVPPQQPARGFSAWLSGIAV